MKFHAAFALCGLSAAASAAVVDVHIDATVTVATAVITNQFGFAVFPGASTHHALPSGNAGGVADSNPMAVPFGGSHSLYATGYALPDTADVSFFHGDATSNQKFNLGNLLPSMGLTVDLAYTYTWSIDLSTGADESASGSVSIDFAGTSLASKSFFIGEDDSVDESGQGMGMVPVFLTPNSVTSEYFVSSLTGDAIAQPQPVPEPVSFLALGVGAAAFLRRRRRAGRR